MAGFWLAWRPLGLIVAGILLLAVSILWQADAERQRQLENIRKSMGRIQ